MVEESLSTRGPRLNDTTMHRQGRMYGPDNLLRIDVEEKCQRLLVNPVGDETIIIAQGEVHDVTLRFLNSGSEDIDGIWMRHRIWYSARTCY